MSEVGKQRKWEVANETQNLWDHCELTDRPSLRRRADVAPFEPFQAVWPPLLMELSKERDQTTNGEYADWREIRSNRRFNWRGNTMKIQIWKRMKMFWKIWNLSSSDTSKMCWGLLRKTWRSIRQFTSLWAEDVLIQMSWWWRIKSKANFWMLI